MENSSRFLALLLMVVATLVGCNQKSVSRASSVGGRPRVALVVKSLANEFCKAMEHGAKRQQQAHATRNELPAAGTKDEPDVSRQVELVEQMTAQKVDAIVIAPADSKALIAVCKKA